MAYGIEDYPFGDGRPDCPDCRGRGVVPAPLKPGRIIVGGQTTPCGCILERDILRNVERGWRGLTQAVPIPSSPLNGMDGRNLRITSGHKAIREHLRHIAIRQGPNWAFNVVSDADLMDAWLARVDDDDIHDGDVELRRRQPVTSKYGALVDLVEPPDLLIMVMGVKAARNSAMPEVVLEALQHRVHKDKVTWIVDQPEYRLTSGHISYSEHVGSLIGNWPHVDLSAKPNVPQRKPVRPRHQIADINTFEVDAGPDSHHRSKAQRVGEDSDPEWVKDAVDKLNNGKKKFRGFK